MNIPHLRDRLVKIISDFGLSQALRQGCATILNADSVKLQARYVAASAIGLRVDAGAVCLKCYVPILSDDGRRKPDSASVVVFHCSHVFHAQCLLPIQELSAEGVPVGIVVGNVLTASSLKRQTDFICPICFPSKAAKGSKGAK
jgi:hypothetical protein